MFSVCIMLLLVILLVPILVVTCGNSQKDKKKKDKDIRSKKKKTKKKVRKMASGDITTDANSNVHSAINGQASSLYSSNQKQSLMVDHSKMTDGSSIEASTRPPSSLDDYYHSRQTTKVRSVSAYFKKGTTSKKNPGDGAGHTQTPPQKKDDKKTKNRKPDDDKKDKDYRDKN